MLQRCLPNIHETSKSLKEEEVVETKLQSLRKYEVVSRIINSMNDIFSKCEVCKLRADDTEEFPHGGILVEGNLIKLKGDEEEQFILTLKDNFSLVMPSNSKFQAIVPSVLLKFTKPVIKGFSKKTFLKGTMIKPIRKNSSLLDDGKSAKSKNIIVGFKQDMLVSLYLILRCKKS